MKSSGATSKSFLPSLNPRSWGRLGGSPMERTSSKVTTDLRDAQVAYVCMEFLSLE